MNVSRNDPLDETLLHAAKEITIHDWTFDFDKFLTGQYYEEATFHFSDIFSNVEYIALEDAGENIIGNFDKTIVTEEGDFIFYDSYSCKIARFSSTGKFLNTFGQRGHAKNEYVQINDFQYDEKNRLVFISSTGNGGFKVYSIDGEYIKDIKIPCYYQGFGLINGQYIVVFLNHMANLNGDEVDYNYKVFDYEGNLVEQFQPFKADRKDYSPIASYMFDNQNGKLYCHEPYSSLIFTFDGSEIRPLYYLNFGRKSIPHELLYSKSEEQVKDWLRENSSLDCQLFFESETKYIMRLEENSGFYVTYIQDKNNPDNYMAKLRGYNDIFGLANKNYFIYAKGNKIYYEFSPSNLESLLKLTQTNREWLETTRGKITDADIAFLEEMSKKQNSIIQVCTLKE